MATLTQTATRTPVPAFAAQSQSLSQPQAFVPLSAQGTFAFAKVGGKYCLVQFDPEITKSSSFFLTPIDLTLFHHEVATSFRCTGSQTFHPSEVQILETLNSDDLLCDDKTGVVFLSIEQRDRLMSLSTPIRARRRY